jgi:hypothetical protein
VYLFIITGVPAMLEHPMNYITYIILYFIEREKPKLHDEIHILDVIDNHRYNLFACSIVDQKTPKERMIQTVRWYLSAFHAGRRSHVAKKPYNPILGETFKCYYDIPGVSTNQVSLVCEPLN